MARKRKVRQRSRRGQGSVFQRKDGLWCAVLPTPAGRRSFYAKTQAEAQEKLDHARSEIVAHGKLLGGREITLSNYSKNWLDGIRPHIKDGTWALYDGTLRLHVLPTLGPVKLYAIDRQAVRSLLGQKIKTGLAKGTVGLVRKVLHALFSEAMSEGLVSVNPVATTRGKKHAFQTSVTEAIRPFSESELVRLLDAASKTTPDYYPLILLLARAGCRPNEGTALKWSDVDFEQRRCLIERGMTRAGISTTKTGKARTVDLSADLTAALKSHRTKQEKLALELGLGIDGMSEWIFPTSSGIPVHISWIRKQFEKAMRAAGLSGHRLMDLRHTYATALLARSAPLTYVSAQLGHAKSTTTLTHYAKWLPDSSARYVDLLDRPGVTSKSVAS